MASTEVRSESLSSCLEAQDETLRLDVAPRYNGIASRLPAGLAQLVER